MRTRATTVLSLVVILIGVSLIARTIQEGIGGGLGLLIGALFVASGAGRLWLGVRGGF